MTVRRERIGSVEVVTLDRPEKRNALDPATIAAVGYALLEIEQDPDVRVLLLTGAGDRAFCAGMDLTGVGSERRHEPTAGTARYNAFLSEGFPKPVIAAVNGAAVAGGFELMLACDLAIAAEHAVFGLPEVKRGLVAGAGGTLLPLRIAMPIALELALTGDNISAARAYELGLVNRVVPATDVFSVALLIAESIAANSPGAVRVTRELLYDTRELPVSELWRRIRAVLPVVLAHPDAVEGSRAFLEKRAPRWTS